MLSGNVVSALATVLFAASLAEASNAGVPRWIVSLDGYIEKNAASAFTTDCLARMPPPCCLRPSTPASTHGANFTDFVVLESTCSAIRDHVDVQKCLSCVEPQVTGVHRDRVVRTRVRDSGDGTTSDVNSSSISSTRRRPLQQPHRSQHRVQYVSRVEFMRQLDIPDVWKLLHTQGEGVNVGLFDTGIATKHENFRGTKIKRCVGYTDQGSTCEDGFGHGSFVAGVVAAQPSIDCPGMAPQVNLHVYKVFTDQQVSYTSWFLDALNHALQTTTDGDGGRLDIINLSIGGMDYFDRPFVEKVNEVSSAGITVVTAIGNEGPLWGTCFNPGDQMDVIAVGAHTAAKHIAPFSSRGMTTWELPFGFGRPKPDVVTFGENLWGTLNSGGCRELSGTSVASPVVAGALALVASALKRTKRLQPNPAMLKQILLETADVIPWDKGRDVKDYSIFVQGAGAMNAAAAVRRAASEDYTPHISVFPARLFIHYDGSVKVPRQKLEEHLRERVKALRGRIDRDGYDAAGVGGGDFLDHDGPEARRRIELRAFDNMSPTCIYMWPYCSLPLFFTSQPLVVNTTVLNPFSSVAELHAIDILYDDFGAEELDGILNVTVTVKPFMWPWSGGASFAFEVLRPLPPRVKEVRASGIVTIAFKVMSDGRRGGGSNRDETPAPPGTARQQVRHEIHAVRVPFAVKITQPPPREKRLLWDMHHQLQYPPGFIPRDNLDVTNDLLDWHGDSPFTNFVDTFLFLTQVAQYSVEILAKGDLTTINGTNYGALLLVDTEEYFFKEEVDALRRAVEIDGMSVVVVADWYHEGVMQASGFTDDNTNEFWTPFTGGCNGRALNGLLEPFGIQLAASVLKGPLSIGRKAAHHPKGDRQLLGENADAARRRRRQQQAAARSAAAHPARNHNVHGISISSGSSIYSIGDNDASWSCVNEDPLKDVAAQMTRNSAVSLQDVPVVALFQSAGACGARKPRGNLSDHGDGSGDTDATASTRRRQQAQPRGIDIIDGDQASGASSASSGPSGAGRVVVFTDSTCLDNAHIQQAGGVFCHDLLEALVHYAVAGERIGALEFAKCTVGGTDPPPCRSASGDSHAENIPTQRSFIVASGGFEKIPPVPADPDPLRGISAVLRARHRKSDDPDDRPERAFPNGGGQAFINKQHPFAANSSAEFDSPPIESAVESVFADDDVDALQIAVRRRQVQRTPAPTLHDGVTRPPGPIATVDTLAAGATDGEGGGAIAAAIKFFESAAHVVNASKRGALREPARAHPHRLLRNMTVLWVVGCVIVYFVLFRQRWRRSALPDDPVQAMRLKHKESLTRTHSRQAI